MHFDLHSKAFKLTRIIFKKDVPSIKVKIHAPKHIEEKNHNTNYQNDGN